jgi:hypothetical protein
MLVFRFAKVVWKPVQNSAPELFTFLESFSLSYKEYAGLLAMYNEVTIHSVLPYPVKTTPPKNP